MADMTLSPEHQRLIETAQAAIGRRCSYGNECAFCRNVDALALKLARLEKLEAGQLEPPYAQVVAGCAAVLLTPEQIDLILHFFRDVSVAETTACSITAEMHRARNALLAAREEEA